MRKMQISVIVSAAMLAWATAAAQEEPKQPTSKPTIGVKVLRDLQYVEDGHERHRLDLYLPEKAEGRLPVVVWIHGGAWMAGSKEGCPAAPFASQGCAVASINYRLSQHAVFPAQIEDCKAAIRWLRANAAKYHLDPDHIGVWGASAGGHLVALLGTTAGVKEFEGSGGNLDQSSRVQCVLDWFGPTELTTMGKEGDPPGSPVALLIGGPAQENKEKARRASPLTYVNKDSAPFLIMHGDKDDLVPLRQSELLADALKKAGVEAKLQVVKGNGHGGPGFTSPENLRLIEAFFVKHLREGTNGKTPPLSDYIRPLVGTQGEGNTYPGPTAPFGMVQPGPDTNGEKFCGYDHTDPMLHGFSMTHLSGTGWWDLGDFLFVPGTGEPKFDPGKADKPRSGYQSAISHDEETASAGYYKIKLRDYNTWVELTASERAAMMRITFPESKKAWVLTDLKHVLHWDTVWSHARIEDNSTITGFHLLHGWAKERYLYFAARYSRPFDQCRIISDGKAVVYGGNRFRTRSEIEGGAVRFQSRLEAAGANLRVLAEYNTKKDEVILVKIAVSAVSAENALKNLDADIPHWDFDRVRAETCKKWDRELSKIQIEGTQQEKETFYTAMYHAFTTPNLYQDVTGEYRGLDQNIHKAAGFTNYTIFSLWDTFRAAHPLYALIQAERDADMINSLLAHYDQSPDRMLPIWLLQANETWCMIGYHAVPVIVDAYFKGVKGFDVARAYNAIKTTAMNPDYDSLPEYDRLGWVPCDWESESVSKTQEYGYDDWCIAQMAKSLGKTADYEHFMRRSASYKNIFDPSVKFMRGKDHEGKWRTPFDPNAHVDITEGTSWQYSWYVPQDVPGLIALHGGNENFTKKLDELFGVGKPENVKDEEMYGVIGNYWHGNEPSHHIIYLYCYAGQNWKAAERLHQVVRHQYGNKPNSLSGNDDCGQMSAWYIFTALGFYPVCPGSDYYVIGSPVVKKAEMHLSNGKTFTMTAENLSEKNIYIQSVRLNGRDWTQPFLPYSELKDGGTIVYTMGPKPNKQWGIAKGG